MKVKQVKATVKSLIHVLGGYEAALACMDEDAELKKKQITVLRKYIAREFSRLEAGLPSIVEENHAKTDLTGRTEARP